MKKKTRNYVRSVERACEVAKSIPGGCVARSPEEDLLTRLWEARDAWLERFVKELPDYAIPETASAFAKAGAMPDCEDAYVLPDGRLLVRWDDFTEPQVLTEAKYLSFLAQRFVNEWGWSEERPLLRSRLLAAR